MEYQTALNLLKEHDQTHLLRFWDKLDKGEKKNLLEQISKLDFEMIAQMQQLLAADKSDDSSETASEIKPAYVSELYGEARGAASRTGSFEIRNARVAALVVAGGQGTRLGYDGPKGCYPIGPISDASLFYFHARKILGLSRKWGGAIPFYIMTSQTNDSATRQFFEDNKYFGLNKDDVFFFTQAMWPALTAGGKVILENPDQIFLSPDGHGGTLSALESSGALADMKKRGIKTVFYFQVDNPLVDVADPAFIGFHLRNVADIAIKVCAKRSPEEGLGLVVERDNKMEIVEYTEFTPEQKAERDSTGELKYKFGSVAIHTFSRSFLEKIATEGLPIHIAFKKVPYCDENGIRIEPDEPNAFKFEKFVFDSLAFAKNAYCLAFEREDEFAPLKNAEGEDSPATCKAALIAKWTRWLEYCGVKIPRNSDGTPINKIEIDPAYAFSADELKLRLEKDNKHIDPSKDILIVEENL
jgi:UDP-N-acetylglucosamine/UDP-N-acetylgalactosamine diphosphorylase